jgi:protein SCO1/2
MFVGPLKELVTGAPAPAQNLADLVERVRILCTVYDPLTGRYRLNYGLFIEILTGLSVLGGVVLYLTLEWRRQRPLRST